MKTNYRKTVRFNGLIAILCVVSFVITSGTYVSTAMAAPNTFSNHVSTVYVALDGNDANRGTKDKPYATLQKAMDTAPTGSVFWIRGGVYHQRLTIHRSGGRDGDFLTVESYPGEHAVLDGHGLASRDGGLIQIVDSNNIRIRNVTIQDYQTDSPNDTPMGIEVTGHDSNIQLLNNHIMHVATWVNSADGNAHGISVYGNETTPIDHLVITGNTIDHLRLGSSETIALNGNVTHLVVSRNVIHDCNNIGIDVIGFEGTAPTTHLDRARDGLISLNTVYNISSYGNPAYGKQYAADGIYVDGGTNVHILSNRVFQDDYGIELASEHANGSTTNVLVNDNLIYNNRAAGISMGGYDEKRGYTADCQIEHNTLYENDSLNQGMGQIFFAFDTRFLTVTRNIFDGGNDGNLLVDPFMQNHGNHVEDNVWFTTAGVENAVFERKNQSHQRFQKYQKETGNDVISRFVQPLLFNPGKGDFRQARNSPAFGYGTE